MAKKNVYSSEEREVLTSFEKEADKMQGWARPMPKNKATKSSIDLWAKGMDYPNPLWRDPDYGKNSRWGSNIAPPIYQEALTLESWMVPGVQKLGYRTTEGKPFMLGENWDFYKPIKAEDSFTSWKKRPLLEDANTEEESSVRKFHFMTHDLDLYNQNNELVSRNNCYLRIWADTNPPGPKQDQSPVYRYSSAEIDFINKLSLEEKIRGNETRFWEDVEIGEELPPVIMGPTTVWDMMLISMARQDQELIPMTEQRKGNLKKISGQPPLLDPETNISYCFMECHLSNSFAKMTGSSRAQHAGVVERSVITRVVTNWMGDDAFCKSIYWRPVKDTFIGDTFIGKARVCGKRNVNGEYIADLEVYCEDITGVITTMARVRVSLMSRTGLLSRESASPADVIEGKKPEKISTGERVLITGKADWPQKFRYEGAEATVCEWSGKTDFFEGFENFVFLKINTAEDKALIGDEIMLLRSNLVQ